MPVSDKPVSGSPFGTVVKNVPSGYEPIDGSAPDTRRDPLYPGPAGRGEDVELVKNRISLGRSAAAKLRAEQDIDYQMYDLEYSFTMPEEADKVTYMGPRADVDTIVDHLIPDLVLTEVEPKQDISASRRAIANKHEHVYNAAWYLADLQALEYDAPSPLRAAAKDGIIAGEFCLEVQDQRYLWGPRPRKSDREAFERWERRKKEISPVYIGVVDPRMVYTDPSRPSRWQALEYQRETVDIVAQLEMWEESGVPVIWPGGLKSGAKWAANDTRKWGEYWGVNSEGEHIKCFLVDDVVVVEPVENPLGFLPFVKRNSGGGRGGPMTPPDKRVWGILRTVRSFYEAISRRLTQVDSMVGNHAWGTWVATGDTQAMHFDLRPNGVSEIPEGSTLQPYYGEPGVLQPILEELRELMSLAQWATAPQVLRGQKQPGTQAAYQYVLQLQEARLKIVALKRSLEMAMCEVDRRVAMVLMTMDEPISLTAMTPTGGTTTDTIKPNEIDPWLAIKTELMQETPEENDRRIAIGQRLWNNGQNPSIDWWDYQTKYLKNPDPESTFKRMVMWEFLQAPEVRAALNEGIALEYSKDLYDRMRQARERLAAAAGQPPMVPVPQSPEAAAGIGPGGAMPGSIEAMMAEQAGLAQATLSPAGGA